MVHEAGQDVFSDDEFRARLFEGEEGHEAQIENGITIGAYEDGCRKLDRDRDETSAARLG